MEEKIVLSENAKRIFETLYCLPGESIDDTFKRVANEYGNMKGYAYDLMVNNVWRCNSPVFFNAGTKNKMYSACYVSSLSDSMDSIYDVVNVSRKIFQYGAGIGIPIGNLREKDAFIYDGDAEKPPVGKSSGPVSFMKVYDAVGDSTKSGGRSRRAAILMSVPVWHPDIVEFIKCKEIDGTLKNMNISVNITDEFMTAFKDNVPFKLRTPSTGEEVGEINARSLWDVIVDSAHKTADPGILFIDTINKYNILKKRILMEISNPCGELPNVPWGVCSLSSINVNKFCGKEYDFKGLYKTAYNVAEMMDSLLDIMEFPDPRFKEMSLKYRHIGVGIMGLSDCLYEMNLPYDSADGRTLAGKIMKTINTACIEASADMAQEKGKFFDYDDFKEDAMAIVSTWVDDAAVLEKVRKYGLRNAGHTTIAPTGTTAISCDCSYGIEPCFGLVYTKTLSESGEKMLVVNPIFERKFKNESWYNQELPDKIYQNNGSLKNLRGIPKEVKDVFITAHDIKYKDRIDLQAELQKYVTMAISSTLNLPATTTRDEVSDIYKYAYSKGLKGITIYRNGSKKLQPITFSNENLEVRSNFTRPSKLQASVHTLETGNGKLYITISTHNGKPVEIFMNIGKSGTSFSVFSEALGRSLSLSLQHGVPVDVIIKSLIGINSDRPIWTRIEDDDKKPTQILSIPDGIAKVLQRFYMGAKKEVVHESDGIYCSKCGSYSVHFAEGCQICESCNESKCS
jgi:ribonucleoside-diphosphate reductase alpha chain